MKLLIATLLLSLASLSALAAPAYSEADVVAALQVIKTAQPEEAQSTQYYKLALKLGGGGVVTTGIGVGLINLEKAKYLARTTSLRILIPTLTTTGVFMITAGVVAVDIAMFYSIFEPTPAQAATLDQRFLQSEEGIHTFLALPLEQQIAIARYSRPLQLMALGLAARVMAQ